MLVEMEVVSFVPQLGKALWNLKCMCDEHVNYGIEILEVQIFVQDYNGHIPALLKRFRQGGGNTPRISRPSFS